MTVVVLATYLLAVVVGLLMPLIPLSVLGKVTGAMPTDAHVYYVGGSETQLWPPAARVSGSWHTCDRPLESFETGSLAVNLLTGWVSVSSPPPVPSAEWASALSFGADGTAAFNGRVIAVGLETGGVAPRVYVEADEAMTCDGDPLVVEVKLATDCELLDAGGDTMPRAEFIERLEDLPAVSTTVDEIGGSAWATIMQLTE